MYIHTLDQESLILEVGHCRSRYFPHGFCPFGEREISWRCQLLPSGIFGVAPNDESTIETNQELVWEYIVLLVEDYSGRELSS